MVFLLMLKMCHEFLRLFSNEGFGRIKGSNSSHCTNNIKKFQMPVQTCMALVSVRFPFCIQNCKKLATLFLM